MTEIQALEELDRHGARYLKLGFTDIFGTFRGVEVAASRFERALRGEIMFDGSATDGDARTEESDMLLRPDLSTLAFHPWMPEVATVIANVHRPDGGRFEGDPRGALERALVGLAELGYEARIGADLEFFLFPLDESGVPLLAPQDRAGYYELPPADPGAAVRREVTDAMEEMGLEVRGSLHEVAPGQHRIEIAPAPALAMADALTSLRGVVRAVAARTGLYASFMPKPRTGQNGSGLHLHHSLWRGGANAFFDAEERDELSAALRFYVGGLLRHARAYCAVTNPVVNSYKRLVSHHEAPVHVAWSLHTRSHMIRIPMERGDDTRAEVRIADPMANPYLALAVQLAAGTEGLREEIHPGEPINKNLWTMSPREKQRLRIAELPRHLGEALEELGRDRIARAALGEYIYSRFTEVKREEWAEYLATVHPWEVRRYL